MDFSIPELEPSYTFDVFEKKYDPKISKYCRRRQYTVYNCPKSSANKLFKMIEEANSKDGNKFEVAPSSRTSRLPVNETNRPQPVDALIYTLAKIIYGLEDTGW